jgi:hypothetical protein
MDDPAVEIRTDGQVVPANGAVNRPPLVALRNEKGQFAKGNLLSRPKGSLTKISLALAHQCADEIQKLEAEGKIANPLMAMLYVMRKSLEKFDEVGDRDDLKIALAAAEKLADRYAPVKSVVGVQIETPESGEEQKMALEIGAVIAKWRPRSERESEGSTDAITIAPAD